MFFRKDVIALAGDAALLIFANKFKPQAFKEARVSSILYDCFIAA